MATILAATGAFAAGTLGLRYSLRAAARNGARLNPFLAAIAGQNPTGTEEWAKGGFQAKMDRAEATQILGLRCVSLPFFILLMTETILVMIRRLSRTKSAAERR
jgi:hypothetical protein